jgi:hypothetical protein
LYALCKRLDRFKIKIVGRLIQNQNMRLLMGMTAKKVRWSKNRQFPNAGNSLLQTTRRLEQRVSVGHRTVPKPAYSASPGPACCCWIPTLRHNSTSARAISACVHRNRRPEIAAPKTEAASWTSQSDWRDAGPPWRNEHAEIAVPRLRKVRVRP